MSAINRLGVVNQPAEGAPDRTIRKFLGDPGDERRLLKIYSPAFVAPRRSLLQLLHLQMRVRNLNLKKKKKRPLPVSRCRPLSRADLWHITSARRPNMRVMNLVQLGADLSELYVLV